MSLVRIITQEFLARLVLKREGFLRSLVEKPEVSYLHGPRPLSLDDTRNSLTDAWCVPVLVVADGTMLHQLGK